MAMRQLGALDSVDPREAWDHEAQDFTPWLAENLDRLATEIGFNLELEGTEVHVGSRRADIVARNPEDDSRVLIENQLEHADLHHLGQVLAYLAGLEAKTVVWIAKGFEDRSSVRSPLAERAHGRVLRVLSSFTGVIAPEADLRARSLVNREADGYGLISATLFELGEAGSVVSTEVAV